MYVLHYIIHNQMSVNLYLCPECNVCPVEVDAKTHLEIFLCATHSMGDLSPSRSRDNRVQVLDISDILKHMYFNLAWDFVNVIEAVA